MRIEEVGEGASIGIFTLHALVGKNAQHVADDTERMVSVLHTRPEVGFPTETPACCHITTLCQCIGSSGEQFWVTVW